MGDVCYFLLYKLKDSPLMWVSNVMDTPQEFYDNLKNMKSKYEKYYIIEKKVEDLEKALNFKRFTIFNKSKDNKIVFETILI